MARIHPELDSKLAGARMDVSAGRWNGSFTRDHMLEAVIGDYDVNEKHRAASPTAERRAQGREGARHRQPLPRRQRQPGEPLHPGPEGARALPQGQGVHRPRRRAADRRRVHRTRARGAALLGGPAPGARGEGGPADPRGEPDPRDDHAAELLPHVREALGHDGNGLHRGQRVPEDLRDRRHLDPDQPPDGADRRERLTSSRPRTRSSAPSSRTSSQAHERGQPVLVGTISVEISEMLSGMLTRRGIPHNVLNAKNHAREAEIILGAGQPGAVTIATNMAGRGVDIKLGEGVADASAGSTSSAPSATRAGASTTSSAAAPAVRATPAARASSSRPRTT